MKSLSKLSMAVVLIGLTNGCAKPVPFTHNPVAVLPQGSFERGWFVDLQLSGDSIINVDVRDKLVYLYLSSHRVVAFDRKAGTLAMSMQVSNQSGRLRPLVELKNWIVFPTITSLEVFDNKGMFVRSISLATPLRSNASGEGDTLYFGSISQHGGLVESYDVSSKYAPKKWEYLTHDGADVTAGTAVYSGVIYSASEAGEVDAVTGNRSQLWETENGNFLAAAAISADLKADETGLYVSSKDSKLYCINRTTGKLKWQYFAGTPLFEAPVITADTVYQYVPSKGLVALDKMTGAYNRLPRWTHPTATKFLAQDDRYTYLAEPRGEEDATGKTLYGIIAVDKQTMNMAFRSDRGDYAILGANLKDSAIYAAYTDGKIFSIKPVLRAGQIGELVMSTPDPASIKSD